jgi:hypothetical protein
MIISFIINNNKFNESRSSLPIPLSTFATQPAYLERFNQFITLVDILYKKKNMVSVKEDDILPG